MEELPENLRAKMLDSVIALKVNSLLIRSPMDEEMVLIHQISKVGGDLLNPALEYFGLTGFGTSSTPVRFTAKSILTINEVECPSWATIKAIKTPAALKAANTRTPSLSYFTNAIPIPPSSRKLLHPLLPRPHQRSSFGAWIPVPYMMQQRMQLTPLLPLPSSLYSPSCGRRITIRLNLPPLLPRLLSTFKLNVRRSTPPSFRTLRAPRQRQQVPLGVLRTPKFLSR